VCLLLLDMSFVLRIGKKRDVGIGLWFLALEQVGRRSLSVPTWAVARLAPAHPRSVLAGQAPTE
jgi:hypothetical protein